MGNAIRVKQLDNLKEDRWLSDGDPRGSGQLLARRIKGGRIVFYFRYVAPTGKRVTLPIGEWSEVNDGDYLLSLAGARQKANLLRSRYQSGQTDLRAAIDADKAREAATLRALQDQQAKDDETARRREELTLGALLEAYAGHLRSAGKPSARAVETAVQRHVRDAFPGLWRKPASEIDDESVSPVLDKLTAAGKLREAAKMRSYLRAAFSAAIRSRVSGASLPLRRFGIRTNPLRDVPTIEGSSKARQRVLDRDELRNYWRRIRAQEDVVGALLRFHLLTGCQRIQQLIRLTTLDLDGDAVVLRDSKGRRSEARLHLVPLIPPARHALEALATPRVGPYLVSLSNGERPTTHDAFNHAIKTIASEMVAHGEARESFTPGDLRRTVETRLAAIGVSGEIRGHLQSHGLYGVQHKHYNHHDYANEKREALEKLYWLVTKDDRAAVVPLKSSGMAG